MRIRKIFLFSAVISVEFARGRVHHLTNLDQLPKAAAIGIVSFPKPKGGSGFPARVFAILP
jgi:kynurenine formamidase